MLPLIISDLDGVLANTLDGVLTFLWEEYKLTFEPDDIDEYDIAAALYKQPVTNVAFPNATLAAVLEEACWRNPHFFLRLKPYWSVHRAYQLHRAAGGPIVFATARCADVAGVAALEVDDHRVGHADAGGATAAWLQHWGYGDCDLYAGKDKAELVKKILANLDSRHHGRDVWFVDDCLATVEVVARAFETMRVFVPSRPWTDFRYPIDYVDFCCCVEDAIAQRLEQHPYADPVVESTHKEVDRVG